MSDTTNTTSTSTTRSDAERSAEADALEAQFAETEASWPAELESQKQAARAEAREIVRAGFAKTFPSMPLPGAAGA